MDNLVEPLEPNDTTQPECAESVPAVKPQRLSKKEKKALIAEQRKARRKENRAEERKKKKERFRQRKEECIAKGSSLRT